MNVRILRDIPFGVFVSTNHYQHILDYQVGGPWMLRDSFARSFALGKDPEERKSKVSLMCITIGNSQPLNFSVTR